MNNQKNENMNVKKDFKNEQKRFEFTVCLNDNIIVQRFFNVIGYNQKTINSLNFKEAVDINQRIIQNHLKTKSLDFMNENVRSFYENPSFEKNDTKDLIKIYVKIDGNIVSYREWDATIYPVKVRYTVDVREHIYDMITRIQKCLSEKPERLETTYMGYNLAV